MRGRFSRPLSILLALASSIAVAGCYGSTEPATEIGERSARLNGQGTMNNGPGQVFFEYHRPLRSGSGTTPVNVPGGASGPFSQRVTGLRGATEYEFRLCATEEARPTGEAICAQRRKFRTDTPDGDRVDAIYSFFQSRTTFARIEAASGASGQNPSGSVTLPTGPDGGVYGPVHFVGFVTCLSVRDDVAVVGAVGQGPNTQPELRSALVSVKAGDYGQRLSTSSAAPDCAGAEPNFDPDSSPDGDVSAFDAP